MRSRKLILTVRPYSARSTSFKFIHILLPKIGWSPLKSVSWSSICCKLRHKELLWSIPGGHFPF